MPSEAVTGRICRHLRQVWQSNAQLTLEYVESWTAAHGHKVSRQTVCRALHGKTRRMQARIAAELARFIEAESAGRVVAATLLRENGCHGTPAATGDTWNRARQMLVQGDVALDEADWREGLGYFEGALQLMETQPEAGNGHLSSAYERIGNCYLQAARAPEIARGYYEAALRHSTAPAQRIALLCRLADTHHEGTALLATRMELATRGLDADTPAAARAEVQLRQAESAYLRYDLDRADSLARACLETNRGSEELRRRARRVLLAVSGARHDMAPIRRKHRLVSSTIGCTWTRAQVCLSLAEAYAEAGKLPDAVDLLREAEPVLARLQRTAELSQVQATLGSYHLKMGAQAAARGCFRRALEVPSTACCGYWWAMCKAWSRACGHDGATWVERMLATYAQALCCQEPRAFHGGPSMFPRRLGHPERICRALGRLPAFQRWLQAAVARLSAAGYDTHLVWSFNGPHPGDRAAGPDRLPVAGDQAAPPADLATWTWVPGSSAGAMTKDTHTGSVSLSTDHPRGVHRMDMPRLVTPRTGDFLLQATVHGGHDVIVTTSRARRAAAAGQRAGLVAGCGGLLVAAGEKNLLRFFAHMHAPAEVVFQVISGGQDRTAGRGLLGDGRLMLRLERRGNLVMAHAADAGGPWHGCGVAHLPAGQPVEVGLFAEVAVDQYGIVERGQATFDDVRLALS